MGAWGGAGGGDSNASQAANIKTESLGSAARDRARGTRKDKISAGSLPEESTRLSENPARGGNVPEPHTQEILSYF